MSSEIFEILKSKKLVFTLLKSSVDGFLIEFNVQAKPGAKFEKTFIGPSGDLVIQTRSRPVEGEANSAIVEAISKMIGIPKSNVEIIRGDKSKNKRIKLLVEFTANKNESYYREKIISI